MPPATPPCQRHPDQTYQEQSEGFRLRHIVDRKRALPIGAKRERVIEPAAIHQVTAQPAIAINQVAPIHAEAHQIIDQETLARARVSELPTPQLEQPALATAWIARLIGKLKQPIV